MHNQTSWVVVANSAQAKIFRVTHFPVLEEIGSFEHPESRFHNKDLVTSKPGSTSDKSGTRRHAYDENPQKHEIEVFAKTLSAHLSSARQKNLFSRLYIMANPSFLGFLRQSLDPQIQQTIVFELAKDLTSFDKPDIEMHLSKCQS